jgi:PAS domain S-box-containing protein
VFPAGSDQDIGGLIPTVILISSVVALVSLVIGALLGMKFGSRTASSDGVLPPALRELGDPVVSCDDTGRIVGWNAAAVPLLGTLLERTPPRVGRDDLIQRGVLLEHLEQARLAVASGHGWSGEVRVRSSGRLLQFDATVVPAHRGGVLVLARDVTMQREEVRKLGWQIDRHTTALKGVERQLEERTAELARLSEQYFQLFDTAPAYYMHLDSAAHIVVINTPGAESLGYEPHELVGRPVSEIFDPDDRERAEAYLSDTDSLGPSSSEEFRLVSRTGQLIPVLLSGNPVVDPRGRDEPGLRLSLVDISSIKEHQTLLRRISQELEERNAVLEMKNEEIARADRLKSEFLNNVSHELRTPLHAVIGYAELIFSGGYGPTNDLQRHGAAGIVKRGEDLLGLINNLLDLSRIEAGRMEVVIEDYEPSAIALKPIETTRMLVRKKTRLKVELICNDPPGTVTGDGDMYTRILMNLLGNASRFTEEGTITVTIRRAGNTFVTAVSDTGIGIPSQDLRLIFDEFRQVDGSTTRQFGGSGLGLAICKKLCSLMGGDISVSSRLGQGTTFYVTLPIHGREVATRDKSRDWTQHETTISR